MTVYTVCALDCNTFVLVLSNVTDDLCLLGTFILKSSVLGSHPFLLGCVQSKRESILQKTGLL